MVYSDISNGRGEAIEGGVNADKFSIEGGANGRVYSYKPIFKNKGY